MKGVMKAIGPGALALCCLLTIAAADVIVYRGTCRIDYDITLDGNTVPPPKSSAFVIVDYITGTWNRFHFYRAGGKRVYYGFADAVSTFHGGTAVLTSGRTASVFARGSGAEGPSGFNCNMTHLRGINVPFVVRTEPAIGSVTRPRAVTLAVRQFQGIFGDVTFAEQVYTLTLDPVRTIKANNANQTMAEATAAIISEFEKRGYILDQP